MNPKAFLVSAAAQHELQVIGWDAAELFARHFEAGAASPGPKNADAAASNAQSLSVYWLDEKTGQGLVVVEDAEAFSLLTTDELLPSFASPGNLGPH